MAKKIMDLKEKTIKELLEGSNQSPLVLKLLQAITDNQKAITRNIKFITICGETISDLNKRVAQLEAKIKLKANLQR